MSKIPSPSLKWRVWVSVREVVFFPVPEEAVCSFFIILFDIFWAKYKFGLSIKTWRRRLGCLRLSIYLSKRVSLSSRQGFFCYTIAYFVTFWVIENRVTNINFKYFNGNCDSCYSSCLGWSILFLYEPAHNAWLFEKIIFWASLFLHFHMVLKSFVSY